MIGSNNHEGLPISDPDVNGSMKCFKTFWLLLLYFLEWDKADPRYSVKNGTK